MESVLPSKMDKIQHSQSYFQTPDDLTKDLEMSVAEKITALNIWEQDARQMMVASGEGMPGSKEGTDKGDHNVLGQVERAKSLLANRFACSP